MSKKDRPWGSVALAGLLNMFGNVPDEAHDIRF